MGEVKSGAPQCKPEPQQRSEDGWLGGNVPDQQSKEGLARLLPGKRVESVSFRGGLWVPGSSLSQGPCHVQLLQQRNVVMNFRAQSEHSSRTVAWRSARCILTAAG